MGNQNASQVRPNITGNYSPCVGFIVASLELPSRAVVRFYNKRDPVEQWIKEGKLGMNWPRLSCHQFRGDGVYLCLSAVAYNLGTPGTVSVPEED